MNLKYLRSLALGLLVTAPSFAQVQLFEADVSGIVPHFGLKANQGIQEYFGGLEYTIDGRTTLGMDFVKPFLDTLEFDKALEQYTLNPYAIFEFIEPDNLKTFSFALRVDFIRENTLSKEDATASDPDKLNSFRRTAIGGGPVFALRIFSSEKLVLMPLVSYEFFYVDFKRSVLNGLNIGEGNDDDTMIWHDISAALPVHYHITELNGILVEPKVTVQIGEGRTSNDIVGGALKVGFVRGF